MASAQTGGEDYTVFCVDTRRVVDGTIFGILARFYTMIFFHPDQYLRHLHCDAEKYRKYGGSTNFTFLRHVESPDRIPLLLWHCEGCGEYRFCHLWIKKIEMDDEEAKRLYAAFPILREYADESSQKLLYDININVIERISILRFFRNFVCNDFEGADSSFFEGLSNKLGVYFID